jgi:predicted aspartyl protease
MVEMILTSPDTGKSVVLTALVDSGADATILPLQILQQVGAKYLKTSYLRTGDERRIVVNLYRVSIQLAAQRVQSVRAVGFKVPTEAVLGRDVLNHFIVTLNGLAGVTEVQQ